MLSQLFILWIVPQSIVGIIATIPFALNKMDKSTFWFIGYLIKNYPATTIFFTLVLPLLTIEMVLLSIVMDIILFIFNIVVSMLIMADEFITSKYK